MLTRADLCRRIREHQDRALTLEDLAAWAERVFREEAFEPEHAEQIAAALSVVRDATDPHRFRWEEADFGALLAELSDDV
jgi:hypothetical protein